MSRMQVMASTDIPLFPLPAVIMPGGILPLRIFEARYIDMIGRCMKNNTGFGICAIKQTSRAGGAAVQALSDIFDIGTLVKIVDFESLPDGLLGITVIGECKFRVLSIWQQQDALRMANIERIPLEMPVKIAHENKLLSELLQRIMPDVEKLYGREPLRFLKNNFEDAGWVGSRLLEFLPIPLEVKQSLLECVDPLERLTRLRDVVQSVQ